MNSHVDGTFGNAAPWATGVGVGPFDRLFYGSGLDSLDLRAATVAMDDHDVGPASAATPLASRVRYGVLGAACAVALVAYVHRIGFAVGGAEMKKELGFSDAQMGYLLAVFFWTYGVFQIPAGWLGDRLGSRHLLSFLVLGWSLTTGLLALVVHLHSAWEQFWFLLALRFLFGTFQAGAFPLLSRITADWLPVTMRGTSQGLIWMSGRLGGALIPFFLVPMFSAFGTWRTPFWVLAGVGFVWCGLFWPWFRDLPEQSAAVNEAELSLIVAGRAARKPGTHRVPWRALWSSRSAWALCLAYGFMGCTGNFFLGWLPTYLREHRGLSIDTTKWLTSLPLACGVVTCVSGGALSDWLVRYTGDLGRGRRLNGMISLVIGGIALAATIVVKDVVLLAILLSLAFACGDLAMGPAWASCADIGERSAGTLAGAMNMMANVGGAVTTLVAGWLFEQKRPELAFLIFGGCFVLASVCWIGVDASRPLIAHGSADESME